MAAYLADRIAWLHDTRRDYGDVVRLAPDTVVVHDPTLVHQVLAQTNDTYLLETGQVAGRQARARAVGRLDRWMTVRRDVWRGVAAGLTSAHLARTVANAETLLAAQAGTRDDLADTCRTVIGQLIVDFCIGNSADADLCAEVARRAHRLFSDSLSVLTSGESRRRWWRPLAAAAAEADTDLRDLLAGCVARRRAARRGAQPAGDLLDALLATNTEADDNAVVSALRMALFASRGVPGAALSWIVLRLAAEPAAAAAVRREVADSGALAPENLPVSGAFIKEVLRLHPPHWLLTRTALRTTTIGDYPVRAGHQILACPYLLHRDPRFWPESAAHFVPDRWLGDSTPHSPHAYLPFGAGPRVCPGSSLAMNQLTILTAILASRYVIDAPHVDTVEVDTDGLLLPVATSGGWRYADATDVQQRVSAEGSGVRATGRH